MVWKLSAAYPDSSLFAPDIFHPVPSLIPPTPNHSMSNRTSSPSTRSGNTSTRSCTGYSPKPVFALNAHECHGQITASPSTQPWPSGPCRCGQILSSADNSPFTFARQTATPSTSASATCPTAGVSASPHNLTHFANAKFSVLFMLELLPCTIDSPSPISRCYSRQRSPDAPPHSKVR